MTIKPKHAGKVSEEKPATRREREKKVRFCGMIYRGLEGSTDG
jgi:hypothetical protein